MGAAMEAALRALEEGELVVYPTDTLYGLAARADDPSALRRLFRAKHRPPGQPVSVAVSSWAELEPLADLLPSHRSFLRRHVPGPVTALLPPSSRARHRLSGLIANSGCLGVRIPDHPVAREFARRAGPITATSANRHGEPTASSLAGVRSQLGRSVAVYLGGGPPPSGRPSKIVDLTGVRVRARGR
ncbi:MAG: threonylcarbamoyl-AMP synthase [Thermoplasmata archaeon]|nr:threonylcarbamoyl-AMP synthase [Thermoplasmata archaeon]